MTKKAAAANTKAADVAAAIKTSTDKNDTAALAAAVAKQLVFLLPSLITFLIYLSTTSDSIAGGDAGELVAEGCQLGTAHPPGYPLYTLIVGAVVRLASRLEGEWFGEAMIKTPVYWVNVTSCAFGAVSTGLISSIVFRMTKHFRSGDSKEELSSLLERACCSLSTSLLCSLSPLMWQYNKEAEVFALHNLFVSAILFVLTVYVEVIDSIRNSSGLLSAAGSTSYESDWNIVVIGAFLCGLSLTNQHTSNLLIIPVATYVFYNSSILKRPKLMMSASIAFLMGLSPYVALPILAANRPHAGSWGDVTAMSGFIHHFLRRDYGTMRLFSGDDSESEGMMTRTASWAYDFISCQLCNPCLVVFLLVGFWAQFMNLSRNHNCDDRKEKRHPNKKLKRTNPTSNNETGRVMALALIFYIFVFHSLSNLPLSNPLLFGIHQRFWLHSNLIAFILLGVGFNISIKMTSRISKRASLMLSVSILLLPMIQYKNNVDVSDQSTNAYFRGYAMSILETLPSDSLLLINYDQQWTSVRYLQECEGVRNDIRSINLSMMTYPWWKTKHQLYPDVTFPGSHYTRGNTLSWANGGFTISELIDANLEAFHGNVFIGGKINYGDDAFIKKYEEVPHGLVRRIATRASIASVPVESYRKDSLKTWATVASHLSNLPCNEKYPNTTWEWTISREFFDHMISRSTYVLDLALTNNDDTQDVLLSIAEAAAWLELASSLDTQVNHNASPSMKKNLGLAYMNIVRSKEVKFPFVENIFRTDQNHYRNWWSRELGDWKSWATNRWKEEWGTFLALDSAKEEPGYDQVKAIYDTVMATSSKKSKYY